MWNNKKEESEGLLSKLIMEPIAEAASQAIIEAMTSKFSSEEAKQIFNSAKTPKRVKKETMDPLSQAISEAIVESIKSKFSPEETKQPLHSVKNPNRGEDEIQGETKQEYISDLISNKEEIERQSHFDRAKKMMFERSVPEVAKKKVRNGDKIA